MSKFSLAIETSSPQGSLALFEVGTDSTTLIGQSLWSKPLTHSDVVTQKLDSLLKETKLSFKELSSLAVSLGPGSFTGIRVGLGVIKTLAYALDLPIYSNNSLETLCSMTTDNSQPVLSILNAFKNMVYISGFSSGGMNPETILPPQSVRVQDLSTIPFFNEHKNILCVGDGATLYKSFLDDISQCKINISTPLFPTAEALGHICFNPQKNIQPLNWKSLDPLYIRGSEAEEKLNQGLLKPLPKI